MGKKFFILSLLLLIPFTLSAQELNRIVAVVNNDIVTSIQLEKALAAQSGDAALDERRQLLDRLIEESLMKQRAAEIGVTVSDEEVEAAIEDVLRQNRLSKEQLDIALTQQGMTPADYRQNLRRQILRFKLVGREVQGMMEVSSREVQDYYQAHSTDYREGERVDLKHITFPLTGQKLAVQETRGKEALQALRSGQNFSEVLAAAKEHGADGGEMRSVNLDDLAPVLAVAIKDLPVGESSELIPSEGALHLLVVTARTPGKVRTLDEVREEIRTKLAEQKRSTAAGDWLEGLKKRARIDVRL